MLPQIAIEAERNIRKIKGNSYPLGVDEWNREIAKLEGKTIQCLKCKSYLTENDLVRMYEENDKILFLEELPYRESTFDIYNYESLDGCKKCKTDKFLFDL